MLIRYKTILRIIFVSMVFTSVCALSTRGEAFSIVTFDLRGSEGAAVDGLTAGPVTKDGLTATLTASDGVLNQTSGGFGINASEAGDVTYRIDNGSGVDEFVTIIFNKYVTFDQLVLSSFTSSEEILLTIVSGSPITRIGTGPSTDVYNFFTDNTIPIGQSIMLAYSTGNGFSFDRFTVTFDESAVVPEPTTIILLGIGLLGLGVHFLRKKYKLQAKGSYKNNLIFSHHI